jgi:membrane fusion protein (multidrug efflux system)
MTNILKKISLKNEYKYLIIFCVALVLLIAGMSLFKMLMGKSMAKKFAPPMNNVSSYNTQKGIWQENLELTGELKAFTGAVLSTELGGIVATVNFQSGQSVKKGDIILELEHQVEAAQIQNAKAENELAQNELLRAEAVFAVGGVSKSELDQARTNAVKAKSEMARLEGLLEKKIIKAPFDGKTGVRKVNPGEFINAGAEVVSLFSESDLFLNFSVPERYRNEISTGKPISFTLNGNETKEYKASITAANPDIDPLTRMIAVQAIVPKGDSELRSGMYSKVILPIGESQNLILIPSTAIKHAPYGDSVFILKEASEDNGEKTYMPEEKYITTAGSKGNQTAVKTGLNENELIAASGIFKIITGIPLKVNNEIPADINPAPSPENQ